MLEFSSMKSTNSSSRESSRQIHMNSIENTSITSGIPMYGADIIFSAKGEFWVFEFFFFNRHVDHSINKIL